MKNELFAANDYEEKCSLINEIDDTAMSFLSDQLYISSVSSFAEAMKKFTLNIPIFLFTAEPVSLEVPWQNLSVLTCLRC